MEKQTIKYEAQETMDAVAKLRLLDDDFMTLVFDRNIKATEFLLHILLQRDDLQVTEVVAQREYKNPLSDGRSITIDIYAQDNSGKVYNIEVQRQDKGADAHRARFHSSMIDVKMLKKSQEFHELHDSYVIFITENDVLGEGRSLYHINRTIGESNRLFGDGSHILYVNGAYKNDEDPIGRLMHDFRCRNAADMYYSVLADEMRYFKETEGGNQEMSSEFRQLAERVGKEWGESMAKYWAQEKAQEMAQGMAQDIAQDMAQDIAQDMAKDMAQDMARDIAQDMAREERKKNAKRLIEAGKISVKEALDFFDLSPEVMADLV